MHFKDGWWSPDSLSGPAKHLPGAGVIPYALQFWPGPRRVVLQAGAHIGIWPRRLAHEFAAVVCWEPAPANWECLVRNIVDQPAITAYHKALAAYSGDGFLQMSPRSSGQHQVYQTPGASRIPVGVERIDDGAWEDIDAIFLDVEGAERDVLHGAARTLARSHPLLVCEENACAATFGVRGTLTEWLRDVYDYVCVGTYQEDKIFVHPATLTWRDTQRG